MKYRQIIPFQIGDARINTRPYKFICSEFEAEIKNGVKTFREDSPLVDGKIKTNLGKPNLLDDLVYTVTFLHDYSGAESILDLQRLVSTKEIYIFAYSIDNLLNGDDTTKNQITWYKQKVEIESLLKRNIVRKSDVGLGSEKISFSFRLLKPNWIRVNPYLFDSSATETFFSESSTTTFSESSTTTFSEFPQWTTLNVPQVGDRVELNAFNYLTSFDPFQGEKQVFTPYEWLGNYPSDEFLIKFDILAGQTIKFVSEELTLTIYSANTYTDLVYNSITQKVTQGSVTADGVSADGYLKLGESLLTYSSSAVNYSVIVNQKFI